MALLKELPSNPCVMSFSDEGAYLAVGVRSLTSSDYPALRFLRTSETVSADHLLGVESSFLSPAGFARLAWSKPGEGSSGGGLVAGGLVNGTVAVWDPIDLPILDQSETVAGSLSIEMDNTSGNLTKACNTERDEYHYVNRSNPYTQEINILEDYLSRNPEPVREFPTTEVDWPQSIDSYNGSAKMAAMFARHKGPVRGLSFSPYSPNYLAAGASNGKVAIWDLAKTYSDTIPTSEYVVGRGDLSFMSWSPYMANVIATSSCTGETLVMDLISKDAIVSNCEADAPISSCQWAPLDPNLLLTSSESCCDRLPFNLWDIRKTSEPIKKFGMDISGVNHISFCPIDADKFLAATNEDIYTWSLKEEQPVGRLLCGTSCSEVHYRGKSEEVFAASTEGGIRVYCWEVIDNTACSDSIE